MKSSFNLLDEPWVTCIRLDGTRATVGLRDALVQADALWDLGGESPIVDAATYRLLLTVLHRVFGPPDVQAWGELWKKRRRDAATIDEYLSAWRHRFDLFDSERPSYQAAEPRTKPKSIISLIQHVASGRNPSLFDHHTEAEGLALSPAEAARARNPAADDTAIERRFTAVLRSHPHDFPFYLRQAVSYLKSKEIAVNWHQLLRDILAWSHPDHYVQKRWAHGFWGSAARPDIASEER